MIGRNACASGQPYLRGICRRNQRSGARRDCGSVRSRCRYKPNLTDGKMAYLQRLIGLPHGFAAAHTLVCSRQSSRRGVKSTTREIRICLLQVYCSSLGGIRGGRSGVNDTASPPRGVANISPPVEESPPDVSTMRFGVMYSRTASSTLPSPLP
jgi:hypothetical protein